MTESCWFISMLTAWTLSSSCLIFAFWFFTQFHWWIISMLYENCKYKAKQKERCTCLLFTFHVSFTFTLFIIRVWVKFCFLFVFHLNITVLLAFAFDLSSFASSGSNWAPTVPIFLLECLRNTFPLIVSPSLIHWFSQIFPVVRNLAAGMLMWASYLVLGVPNWSISMSINFLVSSTIQVYENGRHQKKGCTSLFAL